MPQFQSLHKWLEVDYNPLNLCTNVQNIIEFIRADEKNPLMQYIDALQDVTLVRLVRQVSQVYCKLIQVGENLGRLRSPQRHADHHRSQAEDGYVRDGPQ
jgi:hypothetical protein